MQTRNQLLEDLARVMSSVAGTVAGAGREAESRLKERLRDTLAADMVTREEFEAVRQLAVNARAEVEALRAEVAAMKAASARADA